MMRLLLLGTIGFGMTFTAFAQCDGKGNCYGVDKHEAPEIDPSQAVSALALLGGSTLIVRGRRKK
jgi:hypothetical protein